MRSGVMGRERTRAPVALKMAFAMAASTGTLQGSPMPAVEVLLPRFAMGVRMDTASKGPS